MTSTMHAAQGFLRAARRGWWALALVILWAQGVAAIHHHPESGDAPPHRVAACDLCIAQATPAAPPPESAALPLPAVLAVVAQRAAALPPVLRRHAFSPSPRAPPGSRRA